MKFYVDADAGIDIEVLDIDLEVLRILILTSGICNSTVEHAVNTIKR